MILEEILYQLKQLLAHCEIMLGEHKNSDVWRKDCQALRATIKLLSAGNVEEDNTGYWSH